MGFLSFLGLIAVSSTMPPFVPVPKDTPNMNGLYYYSEPTTGFAAYPGGTNFFEVLSPPIKTLYSQVFWTALPAVPLPPEVVERYKNGVMAVVGFEVDQVMISPNGTEVSVPISAAYNHHNDAILASDKARMERIIFNGPDDPRAAALRAKRGGHGVGASAWVSQNSTRSASGAPTLASFGGGNGGEYRKTFHGFAPGFAQPLDSPASFHLTPMQIDTWHREAMALEPGTKFVPGPLPRNSLAPPAGSPDALYSGLLECPLTTRITKDVAAGYETKSAAACAHPIETAAECFAAAKKVLPNGTTANTTTTIVNDPAVPAACSFAGEITGNQVAITFNKAEPAASCGGSAKTTRYVGKMASLVMVEIVLDPVADRATLTLSGPPDVWFGVGFNASAMKDQPWALIVDGAGNVTERKLADDGPGTLLQQSVTVISSGVANGLRTVVLSRPLRGATPAHFTFDVAAPPVLELINAIGSGPVLAYHKLKSAAAVAVLPVGGGGACVCASHPVPFGQGKGFFNYNPTTQKGEAGQKTSLRISQTCVPPPRGDLLWQRNPTCDIRAYTGGQLACHHMFSLLDADQEIPWVDRPIEYHIKFRVWYQDWNATFHKEVYYSHLGNGNNWDIGAGDSGNGAEFDVPKCGPRVPGCSIENGTWVHTITGLFKFPKGGKPVAPHMHCHAPTCLSMTLYNNKTGEIICRESAIYGGTGKLDMKRFDEPGYILVPPCIWGRSEDGFTAPPTLDGTLVYLVKKSNATYGHHGEMAHGEIFYTPTTSGVP